MAQSPVATPVLPSLESLRRVHIVGVGGTLMGAFAALLRRRGVVVTGSDGPVYPPMSDVLRDAGVELYSGYRPDNLADAAPDLVVIGNVIQAQNPEARAAIDGGLPYASLPAAMSELLLRTTRNLVVAGTHGKTTTASLLAHVLVQAGRAPSWFIGGVSHDLPHSFHVGELRPGAPFVLEGDEYDTAFWDKVPKFNHYRPVDVILTSVEYDHADIYPDLAAVERAFAGLVARVPPGGRIIYCADDPRVRALAERADLAVDRVSYGREPGARFKVADLRVDGEGTRFTIKEGEAPVAELRLRVPGAHNALNALAVWLEARALGIAPAAIAAACASFRGVKRRQEERGEVRGVLVLDDFAHHPTAVRETLAALRARYADRRLVVVFEPRSATSRRKVFQAAYAAAFDAAALVYIAKPYDQTRIQPEDQFSSDQLVADLRARGADATLLDTADGDVSAAVATVAARAQQGDLIAVLSNGGFGGFIPKLLDRLGAPASDPAPAA